MIFYKNLHPDYIREVINKNKIHKYNPGFS